MKLSTIFLIYDQSSRKQIESDRWMLIFTWFFLFQEFLALGFETLFPKTIIAGRETEARFDLSHLINGTYDLLKSQKQQIRARDDLEAK